MRNMSLALRMSVLSHKLYNQEGIRNPIGTPRSHFMRKIGLMIQESKTLDIDQIPIQPKLPYVIQF